MGLDTFICFLELAKVFDRVNRDNLFVKLANIYISGDMLDSIKALYAECKAAVNVNGNYTVFFTIISGVNQGDVISPMLVSIFINDLMKGIKDFPERRCRQMLEYYYMYLLTVYEISLQSMLDYLFHW